MKWALVDSESIVQNVIVYDGNEPYTTPAGITAQEVNDWVNIGDPVDKPEPLPTPEPEPEPEPEEPAPEEPEPK